MIKFKDMQEEDIVFLSQLLNESNIITALHNTVMDYNGWLETYLTYWKNDKDEKHFIIYSDEIPIGWLKINGLENNETAWIAMLVISTAYQGKGVGKNAVIFSEDYLKAKGFHRVCIRTTDDNVIAKKLYEKCGYTITKYSACTTEDGTHRMGYTFLKLLVE